MSIVAMLLVMLVGCGQSAGDRFKPTPTPPSDPAERYVRDFGGSVDVYRRIMAMTDCAELKRAFDDANAKARDESPEARANAGYSDAANLRMNALHCF
jgi:hypothetical protein